MGVSLFARMTIQTRMALVCVGWALGCGDRAQQAIVVDPSPQHMPHGAVAAVGSELISPEQIQRVSLTFGDTQRRATDRLIYDALHAAAARDADYMNKARVRVGVRATLARTVIDELVQSDAVRPISSDELARFTRRHWTRLDRPESRRTVHAIVRLEQDADPARVGEAQKLAEGIEQAVRGAVDEKQFKARAQEVSASGWEVRVEALPPVTRDGRIVVERAPGGDDDPEPRFDPDFVRHVFALTRVGHISAPFRTRFGVHVVLFVEELPALELDEHQRREQLSPEIHAFRVRQQMEDLLSQQRQRTSVLVQHNADAVLDLVSDAMLEQTLEQGH